MLLSVARWRPEWLVLLLCSHGLPSLQRHYVVLAPTSLAAVVMISHHCLSPVPGAVSLQWAGAAPAAALFPQTGLLQGCFQGDAVPPAQ